MRAKTCSPRRLADRLPPLLRNVFSAKLETSGCRAHATSSWSWRGAIVNPTVRLSFHQSVARTALALLGTRNCQRDRPRHVIKTLSSFDTEEVLASSTAKTSLHMIHGSPTSRSSLEDSHQTTRFHMPGIFGTLIRRGVLADESSSDRRRRLLMYGAS